MTCKFHDDIHAEIENLREILILVGSTFGLSDPLTIDISQELDELVNQAQNMMVTV